MSEPELKDPNAQAVHAPPWSKLAITGFVLMVLSPVPSIVSGDYFWLVLPISLTAAAVSMVAAVRTRGRVRRGLGLAIAGSIIGFIISVLTFGLIVAVVALKLIVTGSPW